MLQGSSHSSAESQHCPDPPSSTQQSLSEPQPQPEHSPESSPKAKHPPISIADAQCETDRLGAHWVSQTAAHASKLSPPLAASQPKVQAHEFAVPEP